MSAPVLIIGAGPYGVSIALELHRRGIPFVICGELFSLWHRHTLGGASLRSDIHVSEVFAKDRRFRLDAHLDAALPAEEAARIRKSRIPVDVFRNYLNEVQRKLPFPIVQDRIVDLQYQDDRYKARTSGGSTIGASQVVLACGIESHRYLPDSLKALNADRVIHSWFTEEYEQLRGKRVLVVGRGQSAGETVWQLRQHNQVTWVHRSAPYFYADPIALPRPIFALALRGSHVFSLLPGRLQGWLRRQLLESTMTPDLRADVYATDVRQVVGDVESLKLCDRSELVYSPVLDAEFDLVVACTGYRQALSRVPFLSPQIIEQVHCDETGMPLLDRRFRTSLRTMYIVGAMAEPKHGPAMRFMSGCRTAALLVGRAVSRARTHSVRSSVTPGSNVPVA